MSLVVSWPDRKRWLFFTFVSLQILAIIGITAAVIDQHDKASGNATLAYAISLLLTSVAMWYFVANGIFFEQKWRIIFFLVAAVLVFAYALYRYLRGRDDEDVGESKDELLARLIISGVCLPIDFVGSYFILTDMDWLAWHIAGCDEERMQAFHWLSRFRSFLDLDFMVAITLVVLAAFSHTLTEPQLGLAISGLVISLAWIVVGTAGARRENTVFMVVFYALSTLEPTFIVYKFVEFANNWDHYKHKDTTNPVIFLGCVAILLRAVVVALAVKVHRNFNLGLKQALLSAGDSSSGQHYRSI
ncbi:hypothetical protein PTSG_03925 [Salpingoeca rosetta]|uniref:DUF7789 domain-containing protein n=1 Tax=Salpingoeca rosetta (strain ATCC 50818 / BSB-021) TaxID=946362 RepID=F2U7A0_SALR5|nr:uncharacterized protein PTSG_03925 [Salpingoeca rosetta]EGD83317.1 hypothetical protein PTSG_03925 [Salpingoeca rosetta]|eukprot:XP_004994821.1 hypothetical protein PTSG_03925 [Salpingoeca rosetta]